MASRWLLCLTACCALFLASAVLRAGEPPAIVTPRFLFHPPTARRSIATASPVTTAELEPEASHSTRWTSRVSRPTPRRGRKSSERLRGRMMPPPGLPRPDDATYDALSAHLEEALDRAVVGSSESRTHRHVPSSEPRRVSERDSRHPRARRRRLGAPAQGRCEPWVRQREQRRAVADAARAVSGRGAEGEPGCDRQCAAVAGESPRRAAGGSHAGGSPRGIAVRDPRRRDVQIHVPASTPSTSSRSVWLATGTRTSKV